jgi:hypothetical protein
MTSSPRDQRCDLVDDDIRDQSNLAEKFDQKADLSLGVAGASVLLSDLGPIAPGDVVEP